MAITDAERLQAAALALMRHNVVTAPQGMLFLVSVIASPIDLHLEIVEVLSI